MKQMFIVGHGGPEKLQLRQSPDPSPAQGEVRIRVKASGVNFADILARQGLYPDAPRIPCVVGYEVSGTIDAVGLGSGQSWIDRDVFALTCFGGYSDVVVVPEKHVFPTRFPTNRPRQSQLTTSLRGSCSWSWAR